MSQEIYTVSQLNAEARLLVEDTFQHISLIGEISNLARPSSGHLYFSLKDSQAQVRCAFFRLNQRQLDFTPEDGQQVLVQARVSLYEARGDFQLIVSQMQLSGEGALQIAFEKLKQKLAEEGLFDKKHKHEIPEMPQCIGVISSDTGAAVYDILHVLGRRFPSIPVIIYPSMVQGDAAAKQLVSAIKKANTRKECNVIILARGGGSLEDLWPFNEEMVARAIYASDIPVVTGIGHEVDFTIADFVADQRCATPSAAAEWVSPDREEWQRYLDNLASNLLQLILSQLRHGQTELSHLRKRLQHPGQRLREQMQHVDQLEQRLVNTMRYQLNVSKDRLTAMARTLDTVSPLNTLKRGYAIVQKDGHIIIKANQVKKGDTITTRLSKGSLSCTVEQLKNDNIK